LAEILATKGTKAQKYLNLINSFCAFCDKQFLEGPIRVEFQTTLLSHRLDQQ
jgi:hypothetical protein